MKRLIGGLILALPMLSVPVFAADDEVAAKPDPTHLLKSRLRGTTVVEAVETPVEGIYQTRFGSKFAYVTGNGRYVFIGDMIDLETQINLTELSRRDAARDELAKADTKEMAVFPAKDQTLAVLNVFTDTSCPYCKKLHEEVPQLQKAGIEVRYIPFPRGGKRGPGYQELRQVWCGSDKAKTMDIAKGIEPGDLPTGDCDEAVAVDNGYDLGNRVGVTGTPALFTDSGRRFDGYVPHQQLIPALLNVGG